MTRLHDDFSQGLGAHWQTCQVGSSRLELTGSSLRLVNTDAAATHYSNAQIDDYRGLPRRRFLWSPPLTLTVRARFSHPSASVLEPRFLSSLSKAPERESIVVGASSALNARNRGSGVLLGTAGLGFWNDPFLLTEKRPPALPRAIWFFYASPPSNMKLDLHTPGWGWKAATIDAARLPFFLLAPTIPVAVPVMRVEAAYRRLWPIGQRAIGVSEAAVDVDMTLWHTYVVEWGTSAARFLVDGEVVLDCAKSPKGPLGLVIWIDNQFMVITPQGRLRHGLLARPGEQWLEIASVDIRAG